MKMEIYLSDYAMSKQSFQPSRQICVVSFFSFLFFYFFTLPSIACACILAHNENTIVIRIYASVLFLIIYFFFARLFGLSPKIF